jgi:hypothetical protein
MRFIAFAVAFKAAEAFAYSELPSPVPSSIKELMVLLGLGVAVIVLGTCKHRNKN